MSNTQNNRNGGQCGPKPSTRGQKPSGAPSDLFTSDYMSPATTTPNTSAPDYGGAATKYHPGYAWRHGRGQRAGRGGHGRGRADPPAHAPAGPRAGRSLPVTPALHEDDFPSLGSPVSQLSLRQMPELAATAAAAAPPPAPRQPRAARGRGRKFVPFTDFDPAAGSKEQAVAKPLPPPRSRRNEAFVLQIEDVYRGKIIFIDELAGIDYSNHPAVVRSVDVAAKTVKFFKKSSFKNIGGFFRKYGEYVNQAQKKWHEKQWLLVDDGCTAPHHGTPLLRLAGGEKMPEMGSYVDIHGDTVLPIGYLSKYSRYGQFPDIWLPEIQMRILEEYSEWYLKKDEEYRAVEEGRKRRRAKMGSLEDVDVGDVYEDAEKKDGE